MTDAPKRILELRHRIKLSDGAYVVIENFGDQAPKEWLCPTREAAEVLVVQRKAILLKMIADISEDAADAVADARHIDNMKAGRA